MQLAQPSRFARIRRSPAHRRADVFLWGDVQRYHQYSSVMFQYFNSPNLRSICTNFNRKYSSKFWNWERSLIMHGVTANAQEEWRRYPFSRHFFPVSLLGRALRSNNNHESRLTELCNVRRMVQDGLLFPVVLLLPLLDDLRPDHLLAPQITHYYCRLDKPTTVPF